MKPSNRGKVFHHKTSGPLGRILSKWFLALIFGICIIAGQPRCRASTPTLTWYVEGAGSLDDFGSGVAVDHAGNTYFGSSHQGPARLSTTNISGAAFVISKLRASGDVIWRLAFPSDSNEMTQARFLLDANENVIVALNSATAHSFGTGVSFLKISPTGTLLWAAGSGAGGYPFLNSPFSAIDSDGNAIFTFSLSGNFQFGSLRVGSSNMEVLTLKVSPGGDLLWAKRGSGAAINQPTGLCSDTNSNFYITGSFTSPSLTFGSLALAGSQGITTGFLCKFDRNGDPIWGRTWRTLNGGMLNNMGVARFPGGEIAVCGRTLDGLALSTNLFSGEAGYVIRFDENGTFRAFLQINRQVVPFEILADVDSQLILSGILSNSNDVGTAVFGGISDCFVAKLEWTGGLVWSKVFGSSYTDGNYYGQTVVDPNGPIYVGTSTYKDFGIDQVRLQGAGGQDAILLKLTPPPLLAPPVISVQPSSMSVSEGAEAGFSVVSTNGISFQWFWNDQLIAGATNASLTIPRTSLTNAGSYTVEITNASGTIRSEAATLTVQPGLSILVATIAGTGVPGHLDATNALQGELNAPDGPSVASDGTIYFADTLGNAIRTLGPDGSLGTIAGNGKVGYLDGVGADAYFSFPNGTRALRDGDIIVTDAENDVLRLITGIGEHSVRTFAGDGARGYLNGPALSARFAFPNDAVEDSSGTLYVSEFDNNVIRKIARDGVVTTWAGSGAPGGSDGVGTTATFNQPGGLALDSVGNLFVTEFTGQRVRKIDPRGAVTTLAGDGTTGYRDGAGPLARFNKPNGIVVTPDGNIYLTESGNHTIRRISPSGFVDTVAGTGAAGFANGDRGTAMFNSPGGIALGMDGSLIVADTGNHRIRRIILPQSPQDRPLLTGDLFFGVTIFGKPGDTFQIEASESAGSPSWTALTNLTLNTPSVRWIDPRPASNRSRIYRAVQVSPETARSALRFRANGYMK